MDISLFATCYGMPRKSVWESLTQSKRSTTLHDRMSRINN